MLAGLGGCAPIEGTYRVDTIVFVWDPQPRTYADNAFAGEVAIATGATDYASFVVDTGSTSSGVSRGQTRASEISHVTRDGDVLWFEWSGLVLTGGRSGDGWLVTGGITALLTQGTTSDGDPRSSVEYESRSESSFHITPTPDGLHGEGREASLEVTRYVHADEWEPAFSGDSFQLLRVDGVADVLTPTGETAVNSADADDCEGDRCEITETNHTAEWQVSFEAVRLEP